MQASIMSGGTNFNSQVGRFDSEALISELRTFANRAQPIVQTYVVAEEVQRQNVLQKKIVDRSRL